MGSCHHGSFICEQCLSSELVKGFCASCCSRYLSGMEAFSPRMNALEGKMKCRHFPLKDTGIGGRHVSKRR